MTGEETARLRLPLMAAGQAHKEMAHNEALAMLDLLVQPVVEAVGVNMPPAAPAIGQCWIVGSEPTAEWSDRAGAVAGWTGAGWRFAAPREGMTVRRRADAAIVRRTATGWVVAGGIAEPGGGAVIDVEARAAVAAVLTTLRQHGLITS